MPEFYFTERDSDLISGKNARDPLGMQVIWSAMGRKIIPNLTETSRNIRGFQLLISTYALYDLFKNYNKVVETNLQNRSFSEVFSLENFFILCEQAFAYAYYKVNGDYPLPGKVQVAASIDNPVISLNRPILQSQLVNGVWGQYRNAAIRSGLIDLSGSFLTRNVKEQLLERLQPNIRTYNRLFVLIRNALADKLADLPSNSNHKIYQTLANELDSIPDRILLKKHLLMEGELEPLAKFSYQQLHKENGDFRYFFNKCISEFPKNKNDFINIIRCEDFVGTLESVFFWLLNKSGESVDSVSRGFKKHLNLNDVEKAKNEFAKIDTFPAGAPRKRSEMFLQKIDITNPKDFLKSIIDIHETISRERGSAQWLYLTDSEKVIVETDQYDVDEIEVTPGKGWRNGYYILSLLSIYRGLR